MKALEFKGSVAADGQIVVPPQIAHQIPAGVPLQVVVMWGTVEVEDVWKAQGRPSFEAAYAPEDSVYEQLVDATPLR